MEALMSTITAVGGSVITYAGGAMAAGLGVAVLVWGGPTAWRAFKRMAK